MQSSYIWIMRRFFIISAFLIASACSSNELNTMNHSQKIYGKDQSDASVFLKDISGHKVFFGHQSVGYDLLSGIEQWEDECGIKLNVLESREIPGNPAPSFQNFRIGENKDPYSKIDDFVELFELLPEEDSSVIMFKFCYIDFSKTANVDSIFTYYKENMLKLKNAHPKCKIVLFTVPVTTLQGGLKAFVKKILSKPLGHARENVKRNAFSNLIRKELAGEFPVFDLALVESTLPDGTICTFKYNGEEHPKLPKKYTRDQGHLNEFGQRMLAWNYLAFLSEIL